MVGGGGGGGGGGSLAVAIIWEIVPSPARLLDRQPSLISGD